MTTLKTIVFPIARILIWAVIGVALLKLAFFSGATGTSEDGLTPSAEFGQPEWVVGRGDVVNAVQVQASVVADTPANVVSTVDGYVGYWAVEEGQFVNAGDPIVEMRKEVAGTPGADGATGATQFTRHTLTAPVAGTVHRSLLLNQTAAIGATVATVDPGTFSITGDLTPQDLARVLKVTAPTTDFTRPEQFEPLPIPSRCYDEKHARISAELYGPTGKKPSLRDEMRRDGQWARERLKK